MNTDPHVITVSGVRVQVVRKAIKNLHLGVYPPEGRVRVAAPMAVSDDAVRLAVVGKLGWIKRQRTRFKEQLRQSEREMVSGESHYFLGQRYRLRVVCRDAPPRVLIRSGILELHISQKATPREREQMLQRWYRQQLRELLPPLLMKWQAVLKVKAAECRVRKMKTKWGSCNVEARRIWINLELAKKPVQCVEYLIVHELAHLIERHHNDNFVAIMDKHLPHWRLNRQELNSAPLANETWSY